MNLFHGDLNVVEEDAMYYLSINHIEAIHLKQFHLNHRSRFVTPSSSFQKVQNLGACNELKHRY